MNSNRLTARENWFRIGGKADLERVRTHKLPMAVLWLVVFCIFPSANRAQAPVYEVTPVESTIKFGVDSSVPIKGTFDKWNASMKFSSTDVRSGVLEIEIQADSVNTGSGLKNNKLKSKDFFDVKDSPTITFKSTKVVQTGPNTFDLEGDFAIRGSRKPKSLLLQIAARDRPPEALTVRWPSIATCCSKYGTSGRIVMQVPAFKLPACSQVPT